MQAGSTVTRSASSAPSLRFFLLGRFRVERNGALVQTADWGRRAAAPAIVKVLLLQSDHRFHREQMLELLWPHLSVDAALNKFAKGLHAARRALEPNLVARAESSYLHLVDDMVYLDSSKVWIDIDEFQRAAGQALEIGTVAALEAALSLYGGEVLPEDRYADWTVPRREQLAALHSQVLVGLAEAYSEEGPISAAEAAWKQVLTEDPANEMAHRGLMRVFAASGARAEALRQFDVARIVLHEELGVEPASETRALRDEIASGHLSSSLQPRSSTGDVRSPTDVTLLALPASLRGQPSTPVVGRDQLYKTLGKYLRSVGSGPRQMVLICGEAGVGKSRLTADLARQAAAGGHIVLWGAGRPQSHKMLYGPFVEAVEGYVSTLDDKERSELGPRYPLLTLLVPSLMTSNGPATAGSDSEIMRGRIVAEFVAFLSDLSQRRPVFLGLDDLHAVDESSLLLMDTLARSVAGGSLLIVAAYRQEDLESESELARTIDAFRRDGLARRVAVSRLSLQATTDLAQALLGDGEVDPVAAQRIYALSLGNPLFAQILIHALREEGALAQVGDTWVLSTASSTLPSRIVDLIIGRIDRLGPKVRQVLNLAAVQGSEFSVVTLGMAAELAYSSTYRQMDMPDALDRALQAGILEDRGEIYAFAHDLIRSAVLQSIPTHRHAHLHGAVAEAIVRYRPGDVEKLAYHFSHSTDPDRALPYMEQAGDRARIVYANVEAIPYYGDLARRLDALQRPREAVRVRQKLAFCLYQSARYAEALDELQHATAACTDPTTAAVVAAQIGHVHFLRGTPDGGIATIESLLTHQAADLQPSARAALSLTLASLYWLNGRYDDQLAAATAAVRDAAEPSDYPHLTAIVLQAEVWRGVALIATGAIDDGIASLEAVIPRLEAAGILSALSRAYNSLGATFGARGDLVRERDYLNRAFIAAERLGDPVRLTFMLFRRGWHRWFTGDWEAAQTDWTRAAELDREHGPSWVTPYVYYGLGHLAHTRGDLPGARREIERSMAHAERVGDARLLWANESMLARLDLDEGHPDEAIARATPLLVSPTPSPEDRAGLHAQVAEALLAKGNLVEARTMLSGAMEMVGTSLLASVRLDILRVAGMVALEEGNLQEAQHHLEELLHLSRRLGNAYVEGRALTLLAQVHGRQQNEGAARRNLEDAVAVFTRLGVSTEVDRARARLSD